MLKKYDIPPLSKDRGEEYPLIYAGGPVLTANPIPYEDFYDFINIGDAKSVFGNVFKILADKKDETKEAKLKSYI